MRACEITIGHFNTGRLYAEHGQRISYLVADGGLTIHFHDHSRMIAGTIRRKHPTIRVTAELIMGRYDRGEYERTATADQMSFYRGGVLTDFDASGENDRRLCI